MPFKTISNEEFLIKFYNIFSKDEWEVLDKYENANTKINVIHKPCGNKIEITPRIAIHSKKIYCKNCMPKTSFSIKVGVNDIYTIDRDMYEMLEDKKDNCLYTVNSNKKTWFVCPLCGQRHFKTICNVHLQGLCCQCNSNGISYPEKYMIELLNQFHLNYKYQYSPNWIKPLRYDFSFCLNNVRYIIEMDGGLGHGNSSVTEEAGKRSVENDMIKNKAASEHDCFLIRIDSNYTRVDSREAYIRNSIINSELSNILDLQNANFDLCHQMAMSKYCDYISKLWNDGIMGYDNLRKYIPVDRSTLRYYLKQASDLGLISETYDEILRINRLYSNKKLQKSKGQPVKCNETGKEFVSLAEAERFYNISSLSRYFINQNEYCGKLPDGTKLTWQKIEKS